MRTSLRLSLGALIVVTIYWFAEHLDLVTSWRNAPISGGQSPDLKTEKPGNKNEPQLKSSYVPSAAVTDILSSIAPILPSATVTDISTSIAPVFTDVSAPKEFQTSFTTSPVAHSVMSPNSSSISSESAIEAAPTDAPYVQDKVVVVGRMKEDKAEWIFRDLPQWQHAVYTVDDIAAPLHTERNKGREANVYLTYIIDNYDKLPSTIAFIHPHENGWPEAWHTDSPGYSNAKSLQTLNLDFVQRNGYANLRCLHNPGCPDEIQPLRYPPREDAEMADQERKYAEVWGHVFNNTDVPTVVATPCCAQFAVSKDQVHKRPKEDYVRLHTYLMESELSDKILGRIYEYMWHIIFGQEPVYCPSMGQCYLDVYNRGAILG